MSLNPHFLVFHWFAHWSFFLGVLYPSDIFDLHVGGTVVQNTVLTRAYRLDLDVTRGGGGLYLYLFPERKVSTLLLILVPSIPSIACG